MSREHPFLIPGQKWGIENMAWEKNPERVAVNRHLHRMHGGYAASGDTMSRYVAHDLLHDTDGGWAGNPVHRHPDGSIEDFETRAPEGDE